MNITDLYILLDTNGRVLEWLNIPAEGYQKFPIPLDKELFFDHNGSHRWFKDVNGELVFNSQEYKMVPTGHHVVVTENNIPIKFRMEKVTKIENITAIPRSLEFTKIVDGVLVDDTVGAEKDDIISEMNTLKSELDTDDKKVLQHQRQIRLGRTPDMTDQQFIEFENAMEEKVNRIRVLQSRLETL